MIKIILEKKLHFFSRRIIRKYQPEVVGITGSVGKTSAKEMTTRILSSKFVVRGSLGNYNNEIGVPLTIIGKENPGKSLFGWCSVFLHASSLLLRRDPNYPEILVLEMGADHPGDINYLTGIATPSMGVVTAIAPAHMEFFKTIKKLIREKQKIVGCLDKSGVAVLNRDDENVYGMRTKTDAEVITYGFHEHAHVRATDVQVRFSPQTGWPEGLIFKVDYKGSVVPIFLKGVIGDHFVYSVLVGTSIGLMLGMHLVEISQALQTVEMMPGRMRILPGIKETLIIDDTYNASPKATMKALDALLSCCNQKHRGRRIAVLGDMLELGAQTQREHRQIGLCIAEKRIDYFVTVGESMKAAALAAKKGGMSEESVVSFSNSIDAGRFLQDFMKQGDTVLVKGSQGVRMERIVKEIMAEPLHAKTLLVRQGQKWLET